MTDDAVEQLIARFFGPGNELDLSGLRESAPDLAAWLDDRLRQLREEPQFAHILPRRRDGRTTWYGLAHTQRQARALEQELQAFVGSSFARVERRTPLDRNDDIDSAVLAFCSGNAFSMEVLAGKQGDVRTSLEILSALHRARPLRDDSFARPLGRLLRDFEMTVAAGEEDLSEEALHELERSGLLSTQNILFLRVRRLGGLQRFGEIMALPELGPLLTIDRPARVSAELMRALYLTELAEFEHAGDASGALDHFDSHALRRFPGLFKSRQGLVTREAVKLFALHSAMTSPQDTGLRTELLGSPDLSEADRAWLAAIAALAPAARDTDRPQLAASDAIRAGHFDSGLRLARQLPPSIETAEMLIRCALEVDSLDARRVAYDVVTALAESEREAIAASRWFAGPWAEIRTAFEPDDSDAVPPTPTSWAELFEQVVAGTATHAVQLADRGVVEWSIEELGNEGQAQRISNAIASATGAPLRLIKDTLPFFLQYLDRANAPSSHHALLDDVAVLLLSEDTLRTADMHVLVNIVATLLEFDVDADRYSGLMSDFLALWHRTEAPTHLDAGIEMLDALLLLPSPDPDVRLLLFQALLASFQRWRRRVRGDQWALLNELGQELGLGRAVQALLAEDDTSERPAADDLRSALSGKTVAIYSLTEPAAIRARDFLLRSFDDVQIELSHDHVATDRLRSLAGTAHLFVIATRSAKHAATTFIQAQRPPQMVTLFPAGKGSASIIRSVYTHVGASA